MPMQFGGPWHVASGPLQNLMFTGMNLAQTPMQYFPGNTVAGLPPQMLHALQSQWDAASGMQPNINAAQDAWRSALNTDVSNDPAVQAQIRSNRRQVNQNLNRNVLPALNQGRMAIGGLNNSRGELAAGVAAGDTSTALANANASTLGNAWNTAVAGRTAALGMAPTITNMSLMPGQAQARVGEYMRGYDQQLIDAAKQRFDWEQQEPWQRLMNAYNVVGGIGSMGQTQMMPSQDRGGGGLSSLIGPALTAAGLFAPGGGNFASMIPGLFGNQNYGIPSGPSAMMTGGPGWWS